MSKIDRFADLKEKAEKAESAALKAEGALDQLMTQLKSKHGCNSIQQGTNKLKLLKRDEAAAEEEFDEQYDTVMKKHGDWFEENEDDGDEE